MNNRFISVVCGSASIVATSGAVFGADTAPPAPPPTVWDWSGFYVGVGGSFNWTHFDQSLQGVSGIINVTNGPVLVAQGQEGGPFFDFDRNKSGFAPDGQLGYFVPFAGGDWLAGLKFTYKYANINSKQNVNIPQNGTGTILSGPGAGTTNSITGFVLINPAEINLKHQLSLIVTIGRAFGNVTVYAGGGPALFNVETNLPMGSPLPLRRRGRSPPARRSLRSITIGCGAAQRRLAPRMPSPAAAGSWILPTPMHGPRTSTSQIRSSYKTRSAR